MKLRIFLEKYRNIGHYEIVTLHGLNSFERYVESQENLKGYMKEKEEETMEWKRSRSFL